MEILVQLSEHLIAFKCVELLIFPFLPEVREILKVV